MTYKESIKWVITFKGGNKSIWLVDKSWDLRESHMHPENSDGPIEFISTYEPHRKEIVFWVPTKLNRFQSALLEKLAGMRKPAFSMCENKDADQLRGNREAKLISTFVFATRIVQSLYFLNTKFQASSHLLWLYSPVCVGPGRKPQRLVFSQRGSFFSLETRLIPLYRVKTELLLIHQ